MPDNVVAIQIGGSSFTGWDEVAIEMAIDNCADGFSLSASYDPGRSDLVAVFRGSVYKPCVITINDEPVLTGRVMKIDAESDANDRVLKVEGMSLTGPLVDCSIDRDLEFSGFTLAGACRMVCVPFGIAVREDDDTEVIDMALAEYGQGAYDFLNSLAAPRNFFLNSSYTGQLIVSSAARLLSLPVAAALIEGQKPLLSIATSNNGQLRFSKYKVATQFAGIEDVVDTATDPFVVDEQGKPLYRPKLSIEADAEISPDTMTAAQARAFAQKTRTAARARAMAFAASFTARATVLGWKAPNGLRWHERQIVTLLAPGAMISTQTRFVIAGIGFKLHPEMGETVDMRLVLPELYAGALPKVMPWA